MHKTAKPSRPARPFVHLRVHSAYSLLEGALPLAKIVYHAVKDAAPAIAVTDTNNLFGALEFAQKAVKEGIQPIIGCQIDVAFGDENQDANRGYQKRQGPELFPLVLIAANETGYGNLVRLVSRAYLETRPRRGRSCYARLARRAWRRADLPDRRPARADRHGDKDPIMRSLPKPACWR